MRTFILTAFVALYSTCAMAQARYLTLEAGASTSALFFSSNHRASHHSSPALVAGISYLRNDSSHRHNYWGISMSLQRNSFGYGYRSGGHSWGETIDHKSGFLCVAPKAEFGLGRSQGIHISLMMNVGCLLWAEQTTTSAIGYSPPPPYSSAGDVNNVIWRPALAVSQHMWLGNNWDLVFNAGCSIMVSNLTSLHGEQIHPGSVNVNVGLSRVYHRLPVIGEVIP